ncbi:MAG: type II toxin-antitoxin system Phd/YefM family antitoxin [Anaerolineae bacterium]
MERQMSATQTRINFGEVLRYVSQEQRPVIVEHSGKPQAVILALEDYQEYQRLKAEQQLTLDAVLRQAQRARAQTRVELAGKTLPDIAETIQQMREERDVQLDQALGLRG